MPLTNAPLKLTIAAIIAVIACFAISKKRGAISWIFALLSLFFLSTTAMRFTIVFAVLVTYLLTKSTPHKFFILITICLFVFDLFVSNRYFAIPNSSVLTFSWNEYCKIRPCSEEISKIMNEYPPTGNGYVPGSYGSYLIWRVPMVRTFIDGRMAAWEENGKTPPVTEDMVPTEQVPVTFRKFDSEYHFTWAILPTMAPNIAYLDNLVDNGTWERRYRDIRWSYYVKK